MGTKTVSERMICWFSCGAPSACAAREAIKRYGNHYEVVVVNCDTRSSEHPDNYRFSEQIGEWLGVPIVYIKSDQFSTVDDVFEKTRYMAGVRGARCTTELKKIPRLRFAAPDDWHVFGLALDELPRIKRFESRNPDMKLKWILVESRLRRRDCLAIIRKAGIKLPEMYRLGFDNNNCPGCVKASSPWYWDKIRTEFPDVFARRCKQSRELGVRLVEIRHHEHIFLDELPKGPFRKGSSENMSCGPECGLELPLDYTPKP